MYDAFDDAFDDPFDSFDVGFNREFLLLDIIIIILIIIRRIRIGTKFLITSNLGDPKAADRRLETRSQLILALAPTQYQI